MGFQRKLKRSYFYMFVIPALIIVLIATLVLVIVSERFEQQLENISDEAILTAAVQSVIKDFKEVKDYKYLKRIERSYNTMTEYLANSGYGLSITADGVEQYNTLTEEDIVIMNKYDDSLYESEDFMTIDEDARLVYKKGKEVSFTGKEFDILLLLMKNPNIVFSREQIYDKVWGLDSYGDTATVTVHLNRIREKIEDDSNEPKYLQTIGGVGYRFRT